MNNVCFIRNNTVVYCYPKNAIWLIAQANFRKDWQKIMSCSEDITAGDIYNPETGEISSPQ